MAIPLAASDEPNRYPIQLYHRVGDPGGSQRQTGAGGRLRPRRRSLIPHAHLAPGFLHGTGFEPGRHRLLPKKTQCARPGLRARRRREPALPRPILRRGDQHRILALLPSLSPFPCRSGARAAPGRAFPIHRSPRRRPYRRMGGGAGRTPRYGCFRTRTSRCRFYAGWKRRVGEKVGPRRACLHTCATWPVRPPLGEARAYTAQCKGISRTECTVSPRTEAAYATLILVARLGLRSMEVARPRLDDVDWRAGGSSCEARRPARMGRLGRSANTPQAGETFHEIGGGRNAGGGFGHPGCGLAGSGDVLRREDDA